MIAVTMMRACWKYRAAGLLLASAFVPSASALANETKPEPLVIQEQGRFAVGGRVVTSPGVFDPANPTPAGQTLRGDHAYVFYQAPVNARRLPLVLWHGAGQFSKTWETTPDGREAYQNIFLRRGFRVYVLDQPRRGNAGRSTVAGTLAPTPDEQMWFGIFRIGTWPNYFPGVQFARDPETLNQYFRSMTPNTGPFDMEVISDAVSELFNKIGPGILVTHSQSGGPGWLTALKNQNVRAIVAYEPGSGFMFPEGEVPAPMPGQLARAAGHGEAMARCCQPPGRRCHARASAGTGNSRQHTLSILGSEQSPDRRPDVEVPARKKPGLT